MFLFFDTETSGLPRFRRAPAWLIFNWPRAVQIGWVLTDDQGNEVHSACKTIKPNGIRFNPDAIARHGITEAAAQSAGHDLGDVLDEFTETLAKTDHVVAHNVWFDIKVLQAEFIRTRRRNLFRGRIPRCTMVETTEFCAFPRGNGFKWPSLTELHEKLFACDFAEKHNALADSRACSKCYWELRKRGAIA